MYDHADAPEGQPQYTQVAEIEENGAYPQPSGGLVSTMTDYAKFCHMLLDGGLADDAETRVLGRRTVELFVSNRLPACTIGHAVDCGDLGSAKDLPAPGQSNTNQGPGIGFGLGVAVVNDPSKVHIYTK